MIFKSNRLIYVLMSELDHGLYEEIEKILDSISTPEYPLEIDDLVVILLEKFVAETKNARVEQYD